MAVLLDFDCALVLRGVALMRTLWRPEVEQALGLLRQAAQIDPGYARAMANLSLCCWIFIGQGFGQVRLGSES
jgi:hypothetical protein